MLGERQARRGVGKLRQDWWQAEAGAGFLNVDGQILQQRMLENRTDRQFHLEAVADARGQLRGKQRMPAKCEEIVLPTDALFLQQQGPQSGQDFLAGRGRCHVHDTTFGCRHGQGVAVDLAVGGQRQHVQQHDGGWLHIIGQLGFQRQLEAVHPHTLLAGDIGQQARITVLDGQYCHDLPHTRLLGQHTFNFAQLDAEAAQLDLMVDTAQILQPAIRQPTRQIAGAVDPLALL